MLKSNLFSPFFLFLVVIGLEGLQGGLLGEHRGEPNALQNETSLISERIPLWQALANRSLNTSRHVTLAQNLRRAAGVYNNVEERDQVGRLKNTVLLSLLDAESPRYIQLLKNFHCHLARLGLKALVYVLSSSPKAHSILRQTSWRQTMTFISYPEELFWLLLATKKNEFQVSFPFAGCNGADYIGMRPSFQHYGFLTQFVPMLEVLDAGYGAIFLDLDVAPVKDPVPYLTSWGSADVILAVEQRNCRLPSYPTRLKKCGKRGLSADGFNPLEPNTGVMSVRNTVAGKTFVLSWLLLIVHLNCKNDQKAMIFSKLPVKYTNSCREKSVTAENNKEESSRTQAHHSILNALRSGNHSLAIDTSITARHCFLSEYKFQNGMVTFFCAQDRYPGERAEYLVGKAADSPEDKQFPVLVHANYCGDKIDELRRLGLWLVQDMRHAPHQIHCASLELNNTSFSTNVNWEVDVRQAQRDVESASHRHKVNGTFFRFPEETEALVMVDGFARRIPNFATGLIMGYNFSEAPIFGFPFQYEVIPRGSPFPRLD